jgi:uridine phosphorylase
MNKIAESELIINPNGSIFHLHLTPEQIADTILLVGDPGRVKAVSSFFSSIETTAENREFVTHTGYFNGKRISVISTGIGTDNIDIVVNELDALVNIDLTTREIKADKKSLNLIRIGTSGALQEYIDVDSFVISAKGLGMDGLLHFYEHDFGNNLELVNEFTKFTQWPQNLNTPYIVDGSNELRDKLGIGMHHGITATACGFYGPQGRILRLNTAITNLNERLTDFSFNDWKITNFEMETSALFGLSALLNHKATTVCAIIANRIKKQYSKNYKLAVNKLIETVLERMTS